LKLDGYRVIAIKLASGVQLISRNEKDLSGDYPEMALRWMSRTALSEIFNNQGHFTLGEQAGIRNPAQNGKLNDPEPVVQQVVGDARWTALEKRERLAIEPAI
jgi:hypothetical protein